MTPHDGLRALQSALGQLRHAWEQAHKRLIGDQPSFARGLLGPAIVRLEEAQGKVTALLDEHAALQRENERLIGAIEDTCALLRASFGSPDIAGRVAYIETHLSGYLSVVKPTATPPPVATTPNEGE